MDFELSNLDVGVVFPPELADAMLDISENYQVPVELPVFSFLAICAGITGNTAAIRLIKTENDTWTEPAVLWVALVGSSGIGKSPVLSFLLRPLKRLQGEWFKDYNNKIKNKEQAELRQIIVDDSTLEGVAAVLQNNPQGVLWVRDELSGLIADFDRYTPARGGTKARLLSSYNAEPWFVTRKRAGHIFIPRAAISVLGSMTPYTLTRAYSPVDGSGWLQRWQYVITPDREKIFKIPELKRSTTAVVEHILKTLVDLRDTNNTREFFTDKEAVEAFGDYFNKVYRDANIRIMNDGKGWAAKHVSRVLRFALVLHLIQDALEERGRGVVCKQTMQRAISLGEVASEHQSYAVSIMQGQIRLEDGEKNKVLIEVSKAILDLVSETDQTGRLPTSLIHQKVKEAGIDITSHVLGRMLKELGFEIVFGRYQGGGGVRCILLDQNKQDRLLRKITEILKVSETSETVKQFSDFNNLANLKVKHEVKQMKHESFQ